MFGNNYQYPQQPMWQQTQVYPPAAAGPAASIVFLHGEGIAKQYPVAPGNTVYIMDTEDPVLYVKSADMGGNIMMKTFDLSERAAADAKQNEVQGPAPEYITRSEFEQDLAKMKDDIVAALKGDEQNESGI